MHGDVSMRACVLVLLRRTRAGPASGASARAMPIWHRFGARSTATEHGQLRAMTRSAAATDSPSGPAPAGHMAAGPRLVTTAAAAIPVRARCVPVAGPAAGIYLALVQSPNSPPNFTT
jgi:hypothetical protein